MPESFWEANKSAIDIVNSLYYSAATITTLSDGTVAPLYWVAKLFAIYEIFCGFSLLVICFTVYTSRVLGDYSISVADDQLILNKDETHVYSVTVKKINK